MIYEEVVEEGSDDDLVFGGVNDKFVVLYIEMVYVLWIIYFRYLYVFRINLGVLLLLFFGVVILFY